MTANWLLATGNWLEPARTLLMILTSCQWPVGRFALLA
jgi:hypothetical protein